MSAGWFNAEKIKSKEAHAGGKNDLNVDWFILLMEPTCNTTINYCIEKTREFQKNIYLGFIDYAKALDYVDHNKLWKT